MAFIRTVCGDIDPSDLGVCYPHEHVLCAPPPDVSDRDLEMDSEAAALEELTRFKQAGGCALVDMTPADYGRNAPGLKRVSEAAGIYLIATTGLHKDKFSARLVMDKSIDELADRFARDVMEGVDGTDIRAGVIKAASSLNTITANEEKVFRAGGARAAAHGRGYLHAHRSRHAGSGTNPIAHGGRRAAGAHRRRPRRSQPRMGLSCCPVEDGRDAE